MIKVYLDELVSYCSYDKIVLSVINGFINNLLIIMLKQNFIEQK
jgi:hypothetical protein